MKIRYKCAAIAILIILNFLSINEVSAASVPKGFEELLELQKTNVKFRNLDGTFFEPILMLSSFDTLKLDKNDVESISKLREFLENNKISESYSEDIINTLLNGIHDRSLCSGKIENCKLYPDSYEIVYNFNEQEVYLFVSPTILSLTGSAGGGKYHEARSDENGLINSFDLYVSSYENSDSSVSLNDDVIVGLPYGYFKSDFNLTNSDQGSELYEAAYHLDVDAYAFKLGHFEYDPNVNSTDYLNNTSRTAQNSVVLGSSEKLLIGGKASNKALTFYVPSSGFVKVYRDDRIIYQANVEAGQSNIAYTELPTGRYEARVDVSVNGQVVNSQVFQVYNSSNDALNPGSLDYALSTGALDETYFEYDESNVRSIDGDAYGKALVNYQVTPSLQIGSGVMVTDAGSMFTVGGNFGLLSSGLALEAVHNQFEDASHTNANLGVDLLSLSYEQLDNENGDPLASHMYGYADYSRWSLSSNYNFSQGRSLYAIYTRSKETFLANNTSFVNVEREDDLVSIGYSTPAILDSRLNVNFDYSGIDDDKSISLLWSVPLSDSMEGIISATSDTESLEQFRTSVRKNDLINNESFNSSLEVANTYSRNQEDLYQDLTVTADGSTNYGRFNGLAYVSSQDSNRGVNVGISSTQIVTTNDVHFTKSRSSSYALIDIEDIRNDGDISDELTEKGYVTVNKNGKSNSKFIVYDNERVIPLNSYYEYDTNFDSESVNLYNSGESKHTVFSLPGTVSYLSPKVSRVVSFVTSFNDISEEPITEITCKGEGCLEVNEMTDGVYRVTVLEGLNFELSSNEKQCLLPYEFTSTNQLNFGQNYCLPIADNNEVQKISIDGDLLSAVFLGAFENSNKLSQSVGKLRELGYQVIQKDVGDYKAVYIAHKRSNIVDMLVKHKQEIEDIKLLAKGLYKADSISYPVAQVN